MIQGCLKSPSESSEDMQENDADALKKKFLVCIVLFILIEQASAADETVSSFWFSAPQRCQSVRLLSCDTNE